MSVVSLILAGSRLGYGVGAFLLLAGLAALVVVVVRARRRPRYVRGAPPQRIPSASARVYGRPSDGTRVLPRYRDGAS